MPKKSGSKDYNAIAKASITRPRDSTRKPKILVYSRSKKGKSTLVNTAPNVLIIDPELGTDEMIKANPHRWPITDWEAFADIYGFVKSGARCPHCKGAEAHDFEWLGIDGLTKINKYALAFVMKVEEAKSLDRQPGFVQQRDYGKSNEMLRQMMTQFHALPQGIIYTAQERMLVEGEFSDEDEEVENPGVQFVPDLPKGIRSEANSIVDIIGRLYIVKVDDKPQRRLWIGPSDAFDTGARSDYELPNYLKNPTIPRLVKLTRTGTLKRKAK